MSLKDKINAANDRVLVPVEVAEWGVTVHLKKLSVGERLELFEVLTDAANAKRSGHVFTVIFAMCDESGNRVYGPEDYDTLAAKDADVVLNLSRQATAMNKLVGDVVEEAKKN